VGTFIRYQITIVISSGGVGGVAELTDFNTRIRYAATVKSCFSSFLIA